MFPCKSFQTLMNVTIEKGAVSTTVATLREDISVCVQRATGSEQMGEAVRVRPLVRIS